MVDVAERTKAEVKTTKRLHIEISGAVQGVGFRPFVFRLANEMRLNGWVNNSSQGVFIEVEGNQEQLEEFLFRLANEKPAHSFIQNLDFKFCEPIGFTNFEIRKSNPGGEKVTLVLPDIATCNECVQEIFDMANRRYLYPFTNCTHCGPRFTIIESLPYDRPNTTMKHFPMCDDCKREYENPLDRRFHAQPNACPKCGPHLELWNSYERVITTHHDALLQTAEELRNGRILALKGIGGFQLLVDARNDEAVIRLRERKHREEKPFALMFPNLEMTKEVCEVSELEEKFLRSSEAPIVLLKQLADSNQRSAISNPKSQISNAAAPHNPYLGVMLPYSPLHHILMSELQFPIVATSGNISDEPICIDEREALKRLKNIADVFLVHNRPIVRHVDDSVMRVVAGKEMMVRRARGFAPLPFSVETDCNLSLQAFGAHLKNTIAISKGNNIFVSQHIGDLETFESQRAFETTVKSFEQLYETQSATVGCDLHPDYSSTLFAKKSGKQILQVQHHYAHILSCMAEHNVKGNVLGVAWDGTGYGTDGTIWGGEFLFANENNFQRVASFKPFRLSGGEKAIKEPRRTAIGLLYEILGENIFSLNEIPSVASFNEDEKSLLQQMFSKNINSPVTTSVGRLFDAVASILGIRQRVNFEGQAAMELEFSLCDMRYEICDDNVYAFSTHIPHPTSHIEIDWSEMILSILDDVKNKIPNEIISAKFHNTLAEIIVAIAKQIGEKRIVLSGGCFQNKYLTERTIHRLQEENFEVYWHQKIPTNDGGISLGQIYYAMNNLKS